MKKIVYSTPAAELVLLSSEDVIATSGFKIRDSGYDEDAEVIW